MPERAVLLQADPQRRAWSARSARRRCAIPTPSRATLREADGGIELDASPRRLRGALRPRARAHAARSTPPARRLDGTDRLSAAKGVLRFAWDLPFAIHFHLHPDAEAHARRRRRTSAELRAAQRRAAGASRPSGAAVSIEDSVLLRRRRRARARAADRAAGACATAAPRSTWALERRGRPAGRAATHAQQAAQRTRSERLAETVGTALDERAGSA